MIISTKIFLVHLQILFLDQTTYISTQPDFKTTTFGLKCIYKRCIDSWNQLSTEINLTSRINTHNNIEIKDVDLLKYSRTVLKNKITKHILSTYND